MIDNNSFLSLLFVDNSFVTFASFSFVFLVFELFCPELGVFECVSDSPDLIPSFGKPLLGLFPASAASTDPVAAPVAVSPMELSASVTALVPVESLMASSLA